MKRIIAYIIVGVLTFGHASVYYEGTGSNEQTRYKREIVTSVVATIVWPLYWSSWAFKKAEGLTIEVSK